MENSDANVKSGSKVKAFLQAWHTEPMIDSSFSLFRLFLQSVLPRTSSGTDDPMAQILGNIAIYYKACCSSDHPAKPLAVQPHPVPAGLPLSMCHCSMCHHPFPWEENAMTRHVPSPDSVFSFFIFHCFCSPLHSDAGWRSLNLFLTFMLFS